MFNDQPFNGAGAGQEKQKVFSIVPAEDSRTRIIIEARTAVLDDGALDFGARVLYCRLLDLSLSWRTHLADGVVLISVPRICELLKCSARTVFRWNNQLTARRHVWITQQKMPNMWPMNTYHISALDHPDEARQLPTKDGLWGNHFRRERPAGGLGARRPDPEAAPAPEADPMTNSHATTGPDPRKTPEKARGSGQSVMDDRTPVAGESGNNGMRDPSPVAGGTRNNGTRDPSPVAGGICKKDGRRRTPVAHYKETKSLDIRERAFKGTIPPKDRKIWEQKLKKLYPRELEGIKAELLKQRSGEEQGSVLYDDLSLRIAAVEAELFGAPAAAPGGRRSARAAAPPAVAPPPATLEELITGAQYLVSIGEAHKMTAEQKTAL